MHYIPFAGHKISRIIKGNWQLAGGHGHVDRPQALKDLNAHVEHGITTFDVGDIYTGAEELLGDFLRQYRLQRGNDAAGNLRVHTKFVPDLNALHDLSKQDIRTIVERSLWRLGQEQLHLVQFHWWDFAIGDFVQAAQHLDELRREGLIEGISLTNFDCIHTQQLLDAGIKIVSNQVQFSLLDPRPLNGMLALGQKHNIAIFVYGTLAGGLLGTARPNSEPSNRSHIKYQLIIDEAGRSYYQDVLADLETLAAVYHTTPAVIASCFALQTPGVSAVILGPRNTGHLEELDQLSTIQLTQNDYELLHRKLRALPIPDDIYSYERDPNGPHGSIMKYNLNAMRPEKTD